MREKEDQEESESQTSFQTVFPLIRAHTDTRYVYAELPVCFFKVILNKKSLLVHFRSTIKTHSPMLILLPSKWMADDSSESSK